MAGIADANGVRRPMLSASSSDESRWQSFGRGALPGDGPPGTRRPGSNDSRRAKTHAMSYLVNG